MCFGITKMYYKKNVGHVFKKRVQIEGTTQKNLTVIIFIRNLHM